MANQEHLDILKQGMKVWNQWRKEHAGIQPDLREADLSISDLNGFILSEANLSNANLEEANLSRANLSDTELEEANLFRADLSGANLSEAHLFRADLEETDLSETNFSGADLTDANLIRADLGGADLSETNLSGADLSETNLNLADLSRASIGWTVLGNVDLSVVKGLETIQHFGPSTIGIDTIYRSLGNIPEAFLKGAGVDETFITYIRSLVGKPIEYYSCFISYSSKDEALAKRLYSDLQNNQVRCWFAPEDLKWGARTRPSIDEAIHLHDKLLFILSKHSIASGWVEHEVKTALARERKEKQTILFPIRVDRAVFESPYDWATEIRRERNIGDFTQWKNHDEYQKAFARLLRDLKSEAQKMETRDSTTNGR